MAEGVDCFEGVEVVGGVVVGGGLVAEGVGGGGELAEFVVLILFSGNETGGAVGGGVSPEADDGSGGGGGIGGGVVRGVVTLVEFAAEEVGVLEFLVAEGGCDAGSGEETTEGAVDALLMGEPAVGGEGVEAVDDGGVIFGCAEIAVVVDEAVEAVLVIALEGEGVVIGGEGVELGGVVGVVLGVGDGGGVDELEVVGEGGVVVLVGDGGEGMAEGVAVVLGEGAAEEGDGEVIVGECLLGKGGFDTFLEGVIEIEIVMGDGGKAGEGAVLVVVELIAGMGVGEAALVASDIGVVLAVAGGVVGEGLGGAV